MIPFETEFSDALVMMRFFFASYRFISSCRVTNTITDWIITMQKRQKRKSVESFVTSCYNEIVGLLQYCCKRFSQRGAILRPFRGLRGAKRVRNESFSSGSFLPTKCRNKAMTHGWIHYNDPMGMVDVWQALELTELVCDWSHPEILVGNSFRKWQDQKGEHEERTLKNSSVAKSARDKALLPACSALNFLFPTDWSFGTGGWHGDGDLASTLNSGSEGKYLGERILSLCLINLTH